MPTFVASDRRVKRIEELAQVNDQYADRDLYSHYDDDGSLIVRVRVRLPAEMGAGFVTALESAMGSKFQLVPAGTFLIWDQRIAKTRCLGGHRLYRMY